MMVAAERFLRFQTALKPEGYRVLSQKDLKCVNTIFLANIFINNQKQSYIEVIITLTYLLFSKIKKISRCHTSLW